MTLSGLTEQEATRTVAAYRSSHVIDPEYPRGTREHRNWCRTCGIDVYTVRNGWRHDPARTEVIVATSAIPEPPR
jgi:hypothetical protein